MNCRSATMLLRGETRGPASGQVLDEAAVHIAGCLLCQEELLGIAVQLPVLGDDIERRRRELEAHVALCRGVGMKLAAFTTATRSGADAAARFPEVAAHLETCASCALDYGEMVELGRPWAVAEQRATLIEGLRIAVGSVAARFRGLSEALRPELALVEPVMGTEDDEQRAQVLIVGVHGSDVTVHIRVDRVRSDRVHVDVRATSEETATRAIALYKVSDGEQELRAERPGGTLARDLDPGAYEIRLSLFGGDLTDVIIPIEFTGEDDA